MEGEGQARLVDDGIRGLEEFGMAGDDGGRHQRTDGGQVIKLFERFGDEVGADQAAVGEDGVAVAAQGGADPGKIGAMTGDAERAGENAAQVVGGFGLLRRERLLEVDVVRGEGEGEVRRGAGKGLAGDADGPGKGREVERGEG